MLIIIFLSWLTIRVNPVLIKTSPKRLIFKRGQTEIFLSMSGIRMEFSSICCSWGKLWEEYLKLVLMTTTKTSFIYMTKTVLVYIWSGCTGFDLINSCKLYNQVLNKIKIVVRNFVTKGMYISMTYVWLMYDVINLLLN